MYVAVAHFSTHWWGEDMEKMIDYVDRQNVKSYNKYFLVELSDGDYYTYKKTKRFQCCNPVIVYDPYDIAKSYLKCDSMSDNFVRTFGSRSGDH